MSSPVDKHVCEGKAGASFLLLTSIIVTHAFQPPPLSIFLTHILFGCARMQSRAHHDCNVFVDKLVSLVMQQADSAFARAYTALEPKPMVSWPQSLAEDMASRRPSTPRARPCL